MAAGAALGLLLAGLCVWGWGAAAEEVGTPPAPPPLPCTLLGPGGAPSERPALLRLRGGPHPPPNPDAPQDPDPDVTFDVTDPWGALARAWGPPWTPPKCELSPTVPLLLPPPWAPTLAPGARSPPDLGGSWWVTSLETPGYGVTALLQGHPGPAPAPTPVTAPPKVTLGPAPLVVAPGTAAELRCQTSGYFPLDVEVRWHRRGGAAVTSSSTALGAAMTSSSPLGDTVTERWSSGQRRGADGTFSRSHGIRLVPARPHHHGDVYTCEVTHVALATPRRVHVRLEVAGVEGPGLEDAVGLGLVAFGLCGLWRWLRPAPPRPDRDPKKAR